MNLVLGDVQETRLVSQTNFGSEQDDPKTMTTEVKQRGMLFVRGDTIILVAPPITAAS